MRTICSRVHRGLGKYFCGPIILDKYLWAHRGLGYYFCGPNPVKNFDFWTGKWHGQKNSKNALHNLRWLGLFDLIIRMPWVGFFFLPFFNTERRGSFVGFFNNPPTQFEAFSLFENPKCGEVLPCRQRTWLQSCLTVKELLWPQFGHTIEYGQVNRER